MAHLFIQSVYRSAFVVALLSGCVGRDFVPDSGWSSDAERNAWRSGFYEEWFGEQLIAAKEKPLVSQQDLGSLKSRFRLLVLPTFSPAFVYRLDENREGLTIVTYKQLDGAGGYDPGQIALTWSRPLTPKEIVTLNATIMAAGLFEARRRHEVVADENGRIIVCGDGTTYVFEYLTEAGRAFVTRHSCDIGQYPKLKDLLNEVSGLDR